MKKTKDGTKKDYGKRGLKIHDGILYGVLVGYFIVLLSDPGSIVWKSTFCFTMALFAVWAIIEIVVVIRRRHW